MTTRTATASYDGFGKDGQGHVSTQSGVLADQRYGFGTRFGDEPGTNPEELAGAAHAACFTMALSFALAKAGYNDGRIETKAAVTLEKDGEGFRISKSALTLTGTIAGIDASAFEAIAHDAKVNCPISKLFDTEITLDVTLA